jgi:hypothetical protein
MILDEIAMNTQQCHLQGISKGKYYSTLNIGTKNSNNVVVFTAGSLSCGTRAARPGRQYRHTVLLYSNVAFVQVCCTETLRHFQGGDLRKGLYHERSVRS